jgi:hypothetical protein
MRVPQDLPQREEAFKKSKKEEAEAHRPTFKIQKERYVQGQIMRVKKNGLITK